MEFIPREIDGNILVIGADGGLDGTNAHRFTEDVLTIVEGGISRLIIDCERLTHVSSVGLGALIRIRGRAAKVGGDVKLCNVSGGPMQVLRASRLDRVFGVYADLNQARLACQDSEGS